MAIIALHSAATGLSALSTSLDVIANNLANANTDGFKSSRTNFQDLFYQVREQPGTENGDGDSRPTGLLVGLGTKVSGTQQDFSQGAPQQTNQPFDLMIEGDGFFQVKIQDDIGEGVAYTRAGNFTKNQDGELVLATDQGRRLLPGITIPAEAQQVSISNDGQVSVTLPGSTQPTLLEKIQLATFINPTGLQQIGENLYLPTAASGEASLGDPLTASRGGVRQGFLEGSNVDPVIELVGLIKTQRAFELNS